MRRRRFLQIVLGAALAGGRAAAGEWRGPAFGADVSIRAGADLDLDPVLAEIARIEAAFSLYRDSELTRLNASGTCTPSDAMRSVLGLSARVHAATGGAFDPTVQPLWTALATGGDAAAARSRVGFGRVAIGDRVTLGPGQALTLNGIAQGYAADRIRAVLAAQGLTDCLIDMGEFSAIGGPFRVGIEDPVAGLVGRHAIGGAGPRAIATSSPGALRLPGGSHILGPRGEVPLWSTVSVAGDDAALCDAASTAFVLMPADRIAAARDALALGPVVLVDFAGDLVTI